MITNYMKYSLLNNFFSLSHVTFIFYSPVYCPLTLTCWHIVDKFGHFFGNFEIYIRLWNWRWCWFLQWNCTLCWGRSWGYGLAQHYCSIVIYFQKCSIYVIFIPLALFKFLSHLQVCGQAGHQSCTPVMVAGPTGCWPNLQSIFFSPALELWSVSKYSLSPLDPFCTDL